MLGFLASKPIMARDQNMNNGLTVKILARVLGLKSFPLAVKLKANIFWWLISIGGLKFAKISDDGNT